MVAYRQTYEIIRGIQEKAAEQCAPVIFGIKPSNLLIIEQSYAKALKSLVETTGLKVRCFEHREERQVWFMFREEPLYRQLMDPDNRAFMKQFGYTEDMTMKKRPVRHSAYMPESSRLPWIWSDRAWVLEWQNNINLYNQSGHSPFLI